MAGLPPPPAGGHTAPPGHHVYAVYAPARAFRPCGVLATAATVFLGIMAVLALFGLGNALWLAGWATFPDHGDVSVFADLEEYVSDATLADRMVAAGFVISAAAAIVGAVMVRTLSRQQSERAVALSASAHAQYAAPIPPQPPLWGPGP
jgi:hypothetical protein